MIIGFAGKKQSGKNTSANIIAGTILHSIGFVTRVDGTTGDLQIIDENGQFIKLDLLSRNKEVQKWFEDEIWPFVKIYCFADLLKTLCIDLFGLTYEQCYGTDEQKNETTHLHWLHMPKRIQGRIGYMTAREVLQYFGTNIVRKMNNDAWVNATMKKIASDSSMMSIVCDARFPNEINAIKKAGGYNIYLMRSVGEDSHESENAITDDDKKTFDYIIDNRGMTIQEQSIELSKILQEIQQKEQSK